MATTTKPMAVGAASRTTSMKSRSNAVGPVSNTSASSGGCARRIVRTSARASSDVAGKRACATRMVTCSPTSRPNATSRPGGRKAAGMAAICWYCARLMPGARSTMLSTRTTPGCDFSQRLKS